MTEGGRAVHGGCDVLSVRLSGVHGSQGDLRLSAGPAVQGERPASLNSSVIARTSQYKNLEEQYNILKSKYMSNIGQFATNVQLSNEYKQLERKYANMSRSVSELTAVNESLQEQLSEARGTINAYKAHQSEEASWSAHQQEERQEEREEPQEEAVPNVGVQESYPYSQDGLEAHALASTSAEAASIALPFAAPSYVSQEEYNEMLKSRPAPVLVTPPAASIEETVKMCEALDNLQKNNIELKEDIKGTLLEVTGNLQTTMVDFRDLRTKCEDMRIALNQRELHLRDLIHTLEDRDREILKLQHALEAVEKHRSLREEEIQRFTTECEEVAQHNEAVMKEKTALITKLKGESIDLKAELHIKGTELKGAHEKLEALQGQVNKVSEENASLLSRLNTVKTNAERLLLQRDGDVERLTQSIEELKAEHLHAIEQKDETISRLTGECERLRTEFSHLVAEKDTKLQEAQADLANLRQTFTQSTKKRNDEASKLAQDIVDNKIEAARALEEKEALIARLNTRIVELELELKQRPVPKDYVMMGTTGVQRQRPLSALSSAEVHTDEASSIHVSKSVVGSSSGKLVVPIEYLVVSKQP